MTSAVSRPRDEHDRLVGLLEADGATFLDALRMRVSEVPDNVALTHEDTGRSLTFVELAHQTDCVAGNLAARGVQTGDVVSVLSTDPYDAAVLMIGIWKAQAVFAPVNFQYAGTMLAYSINDASPRLLIVDEGLNARVSDIAAELEVSPETVVIGGETGGMADLLAESTPPSVSVEYDTVASLIYTSGTTGPSKGVLHSHRWLNQYTWGMRRRLTPEDAVYNDLPMYHVGGAYANVMAAVWAGATACLWDRFSPSEFWARIESGRCTTAILLDVMIPWLLGAEPTENDRRNILNKAHMQPLPVRHHEFATRFGIDSVTAGFGQTESGLPAQFTIEECDPGAGTPDELFRGKSRAELRSDVAEAGGLVLSGPEVTRKAAMGIATPFFEVAVLDEKDRPCRPGEAGHWCVRPKLPSLIYEGYLGKPDKTVEANRNLWFHTGDLAVQDDDGYYYFLDRLGDRIRVRGENVSSVHVEEIVGKHPDVDVCAVIAVPSDRSDEDEIVAFVQAAPDRVPDEASLAAHAERELPKFMRPYRYILVDELPRTPTNKIEKHKLRQQARDA